ncbi:MAG: DUF58 domain-containing protein [Caldilineaceae bacterium]|nr:DUF58 domain-containing protein [Caldilineaceae bacterium]
MNDADRAPALHLHALRAWFQVDLWSRRLPPEVTIRLLAGWPILLLPLFLFGQLVTPHPVWMVLLVVLVGLYGAAYGWVRAQAASVEFTRRRQGSILVAGDLLREDFEVHNRSGLPLLWAAFVDHSDLPGYQPGSVVGCNAGGSYRWWKEVECSQRGVFRLGPHQLQIGDPFGLFAAEIISDYRESVLIYPRVVQLPPVDLPRGSAGGVSSRRRPLFGVEPAASVREYVPGDSMRMVHWSTSAHYGHLTVREQELEPSGDVWIVLDLNEAVQQGDGRRGTLEYAVMLAASMAAEMVSGEDRRAVGLLTVADHRVTALPPQPGRAQLWSIMAALAPAQASATPLEELLRRNLSTLGRRHTLVVITPSTGEAAALWVAELVRAQGQGLASSVILVAEPDAEPYTEEPVQLLARLDIPVKVVRTDMDFRPALTYRRTRKVIRSTPTGGAFTVEVEEEVG